MKIEKLKSENVGTHYPYQAMILTDKGEIYATKDDWTDQGYELIKFQTYNSNELATIMNQLLMGNPLASSIEVTPEANTIYVSAISSLFKLSGYNSNQSLTTIIGGRQGQTITLITDGTPISINEQNNIKLESECNLSNEYSTLMLQKSGSHWIELSRSQNT